MRIPNPFLRLRCRLVLTFLAMSLLPLAAIGITSYQAAANALEDQIIAQLSATRDIKRHQVEDYVQSTHNQVLTLAQDQGTADALAEMDIGFRIYDTELRAAPETIDQYKNALSTFYTDVVLPEVQAASTDALNARELLPANSDGILAQYYYIHNNPFPPADRAQLNRADDNSGYSRAHARFHPRFRQIAERFGFGDLYLVGNAGDVVYSVNKEIDFGANLISGPYMDTNLATAFRATKMVTDTVVVVDFQRYLPAGGSPSAFLASPVFSGASRLGVLICEMPISRIDNLVNNGGDWQAMGLGASGEVYLFGPQGLMRTNSRHLSQETDPLIQQLGTTILLKEVNTAATTDALLGNTGSRIITDYRGVAVISAYAPLNLNSLHWGIAVEMDRAEAFAPAHRQRNIAILIALLTAAIVVVMSVYVSNSITRPIVRLADAAHNIAAGDLSLELPASKDQDETGQLTRAFEEMLFNLRSQTTELRDGVNVLAASTGEISTSVSQLAASAAQTASAISQTTTTVEQVEQTTHVANDKARTVAETARGVVVVAERGLQAANDVATGMSRIRQQMDTIAATVAQLSQQSQAIGDIIASVNDLADQSNLLAVNAAIEAAKAGEQGRGFGVVAQEIRNLAEQSKQATGEVRAILADIQKAMNTAVMATEQGSRVVEAGETQVMDAGMAIQTLAASVSGSAQAASQIAASSQQQLVGMEQIANAMESIRQAGIQNADSAGQLGEATRDLYGLGTKLKDMIARFKV